MTKSDRALARLREAEADWKILRTPGAFMDYKRALAAARSAHRMPGRERRQIEIWRARKGQSAEPTGGNHG